MNDNVRVNFRLRCSCKELVYPAKSRVRYIRVAIRRRGADNPWTLTGHRGVRETTREASLTNSLSDYHLSWIRLICALIWGRLFNKVITDFVFEMSACTCRIQKKQIWACRIILAFLQIFGFSWTIVVYTTINPDLSQGVTSDYPFRVLAPPGSLRLRSITSGTFSTQRPEFLFYPGYCAKLSSFSLFLRQVRR